MSDNNKLKFEKCWKVNCTPELAIYKDYINWFGTNIEIKDLDVMIKRNTQQIEWATEAKKIWKREFSQQTEEA